jgi:ubiquitin C-terminal hydrolase
VSSLVSPSFSHLPSTSARIQYTLTAVVQHIGSGTGGHYICYRRFANRWFRMDDRNVVEVDALHVLRAQAYMVSYERV